jgi:hypothetical protein
MIDAALSVLVLAVVMLAISVDLAVIASWLRSTLK